MVVMILGVNMSFLVLQTDFGLVDGAVSAMYGVAKSVSRDLEIYDLTHEVPPFDIWTASCTLIQTINYWPENTVFVSVVDPGVGSFRRSIAVKTKSNKFIVTPDNGTISQLLSTDEIVEARNINEDIHRLDNSQDSHTFHGRDIYAYNGARIASGQIKFEDLGEVINIDELEKFEIVDAKIEGDKLMGTINTLDVRFGSLWSNIPHTLLKEFGVSIDEKLKVTIKYQGIIKYSEEIKYVKSFSAVDYNDPLVYVNSLNNIGVALHRASFAEKNGISFGKGWKIEIEKA